MTWQSGGINPAVTSPSTDISKITNDLSVIKSILNGGADGDVPVAPKLTGAIKEVQATGVASANSINLDNALGNLVHVTGTTAITAITLAQGSRRVVVFDGILTLTNGASLVLPGGANITTAAGDSAEFWGESGSVVRCVGYSKANGQAVASSVPKQIQPLAASVAANALTLTLNATSLDFRSATLSNGTVNTRTIASPISLTISSGSTLGTSNGVAARIVLLAIDNAGTVELAAVNLAGGLNLDETTLISTTAEGGAGAADSANVIYSTTARTNVPFRVVGFIDITEATAGTWATAPSTIQGIGGQSLAAMSSLGYGQTWQDVKVSRAFGTSYTNTTGKPIIVNVTGTYGSANGAVSITVGGVAIWGTAVSTSGGYSSVSCVVPNGITYSATMTNGGTLSLWSELR